MTVLLEMKERLKLIYSKSEVFIVPIVKFLLAFITFNTLNDIMGYMALLDDMKIVLIAALACSFLPLGVQPDAYVCTFDGSCIGWIGCVSDHVSAVLPIQPQGFPCSGIYSPFMCIEDTVCNPHRGGAFVRTVVGSICGLRRGSILSAGTGHGECT